MKGFDHQFVSLSDEKDGYTYACGDTLARLDILEDNMVRVAVYKKGEALLPTFNVCPRGSMPREGRERLSLSGFSLPRVKSGFSPDEHSFHLPCGVSLSLRLHNFMLSAATREGTVYAEREPMSQNLGGEYGSGSFHYLQRRAGERVFGLGDKGGALNKSGRSFIIDAADCMGFDASCTDPLYKHIPFYICENDVGAYGIFYDTAATSKINLGQEIDNYYGDYKYFETQERALVFYLIFGDKLTILRSFSMLCGPCALPPRWSFGYCASTMAYTDAPDAGRQLEGFLEKLDTRDFSCDGFYLSSGYTSIGDRRYVFNWNSEKFPHVKGFCHSFLERGIHIIPNLKPCFLTDHPMYSQLAERGLFIHHKDKSPALVRFWDGFGSLLDFTNKEAFDFWKEQVRTQLLAYGIDCTWNDNNEFGIKDDRALCAGFGDGEVPAVLIRPQLTYLMNLASFEAQREFWGNKRPFLSTRSASAGARRLAQTWSGDNRSEFSDLRFCHNIGLTLSMSGQYFYGHDLGGFAGQRPEPELFLRWLQHGVFEPRFTIHSWNCDGSATMPWSYPELQDRVRELFAQRKQLIPYLYDAAFRAVLEHYPMNCPTFMLFSDRKCPIESDSFMVGQKLLAVCVFDRGKSVASVYLPRSSGGWYRQGRVFEGGQSVSIDLPPQSKAAYFVRMNSIVCTDEGPYGASGEERDVFTVYAARSAEFEDSFYSDDGQSLGYLSGELVKLSFFIEATEQLVRVRWQNKGKMRLVPELRLCPGDGRKLICKEI